MTVDLTRRSARAFSFVQQTQQHRPEPHTPDVVVDLLQSDHLSSQRPPHPTAGLLPADLSAFIVRCIRSCRPFCCGSPGSIRSGTIPNFTHHTLKALNPPTPVEANGLPLSLRILSGNP